MKARLHNKEFGVFLTRLNHDSFGYPLEIS